jgi:hypothetical protein
VVEQELVNLVVLKDRKCIAWASSALPLSRTKLVGPSALSGGARRNEEVVRRENKAGVPPHTRQ